MRRNRTTQTKSLFFQFETAAETEAQRGSPSHFTHDCLCRRVDLELRGSTGLRSLLQMLGPLHHRLLCIPSTHPAVQEGFLCLLLPMGHTQGQAGREAELKCCPAEIWVHGVASASAKHTPGRSRQDRTGQPGVSRVAAIFHAAQEPPHLSRLRRISHSTTTHFV